MLEIENLKVAYGQVVAVWDVSLNVDKGELVAVVGPNGAGKTTLINAISGIVPSSGGSMRLEGNPVDSLAAHNRARLGITQCPEGRKLFPDMSVMENLRLGAYSCGDSGEIQARLEKVMTLFPILKERRDQKASTMSGGEQQMVAIGRSIMAGPKIILFDEPSLGLAPRIVHIVFDAIRKINETGTPVLLVEQNVHQTLEVADRAYVIENGHIVLEGTGTDLLQNDHMKDAYLGIE